MDPEGYEASAQPFAYALLLPCPGEGLGGTGEYCASGNLCIYCQQCKVCGHCTPTCPEFVDLAFYTAGFSSLIPSVSITRKSSNNTVLEQCSNLIGSEARKSEA